MLSKTKTGCTGRTEYQAPSTATPLSAREVEFLKEAAGYLENPSFLQRMADLAGRPLEALAGLIPAKVTQAVDATLRKALEMAAGTVWATGGGNEELHDADRTARRTGFWHQIATVGTGAAGGMLGMAGLTLELPVTTAVLLRSIAAIAGDFGEDLHDPEVRLECLSVFSQGGPSPDDDAMESAYLTARYAMAGLIQKAAGYLAEHSAAEVAEAMAKGSAPLLLNLVARVAARYNVVVSQKVLAQGVPVLGAVTGAAINAAFADHFNRVARYHFGIRKLERQFGQEEVRTAYQDEVRRLKDPTASSRSAS